MVTAARSSLEIMPVDKPRSAAYSKTVFSVSPSFTPRSAVGDCEMTPFRPYPVAHAVTEAAASQTHSLAVDVSARAT
jgi:hypothetical protein